MSCCCGLCECPCTEIKVTLSGCVELAGEYILTPDPIYGSQCLFMFTDSIFNGSEYVTFTLKYNCRTNHFFISYGDSSCSDEGTLESADPFEVSASCSLNCGGDLVSVFADITCNEITNCCGLTNEDLNMTISSVSCPCLNDTVVLSYNVGDNWWIGGITTNCGCDLQFILECTDGTNWLFTLSSAIEANKTGIAICSPFSLELDLDIIGGMCPEGCNTTPSDIHIEITL